MNHANAFIYSKFKKQQGWGRTKTEYNQKEMKIIAYTGSGSRVAAQYSELAFSRGHTECTPVFTAVPPETTEGQLNSFCTTNERETTHRRLGNRETSLGSKETLQDRRHL